MTRSLFGWDLPPGVSTRDIDEQAGAFEADDVDVPVCHKGEAYCRRTDEHRHCNNCGSTEHRDCADMYGTPCPQCPRRGRETPNPINLSSGECSACDAERGRECAALPDEEKERLADIAMEKRYGRNVTPCWQ